LHRKIRSNTVIIRTKGRDWSSGNINEGYEKGRSTSGNRRNLQSLERLER